MKNSIGELSLTIIIVIAIGGISAITIHFVSTGNSYIIAMYNKILNNQDNTNSNQYDNTSTTSLNINKKNELNYNNNIEINKLLNNGISINETFEINPKVKEILKQKTNSQIKDNNNMDYNYYHFSNQYVVNVSDNENEKDYYLTYENYKNIFNQNKYKLINSTSTNFEDTKKKNDKIITSEENDTFSVSEDYEKSYLSYAKLNATQFFKENPNLATTIYNNNIDSIVMLNTYNNDILKTSATGFFADEGIIVTSWNFVQKSIKEGTNITALTSSNESYNILGIIAINQNADIALLKLETPIGKKASFESINEGEEFVMLGSFSGFGISGRIGTNLNNAKFQTNSLLINEVNIGSPLFNHNGKIIGMVTSNSVNKEISNSVSSKLIEKYISIYQKTDFEKINYYTIKELSLKYYKYNVEETKSQFSILNSIWNEYKKIGDIENTIPLKIIKANNYDKKISIKYLNDTNIDNNLIISEFLTRLKEEGYKEKMNTNKKKVLKNKQYKITILYELNYILILIGDD